MPSSEQTTLPPRTPAKPFCDLRSNPIPTESLFERKIRELEESRLGDAHISPAQDQRQVFLIPSQGPVDIRKPQREEPANPAESSTVTDGKTVYLVQKTDRGLTILHADTVEETLVIPAELNGIPVVELGECALEKLDSVKRIICPPSLAALRPRAISRCINLTGLELPSTMSTFDVQWIHECNALEYLKLPGLLETIPPLLSFLKSLRHLEFGPAFAVTDAGSYKSRAIECLTISQDNPVLSSDGKAIYSKDWRTLIRMTAPCTEYTVDARCTTIGRKAFEGMAQLTSLHLPEGVTTIEPFAFARTGFTSFAAPSTLREIGEKAFFICENLVDVKLNSGLKTIGAQAFAKTALSSLALPASLRSLGAQAIQGTQIIATGANPSLTMESGCPFFLDNSGGLYFTDQEQCIFRELLDPFVEEYCFQAGTTVIGRQSFAGAIKLNRVVLNPEVKVIQTEAFNNCRLLESINLPEGLQRLETRAFSNTCIGRLNIPSTLTDIQEKALFVLKEDLSRGVSTLASITVDPRNPRYYVEDGILFDRTAPGGLQAVAYAGPEQEIFIPDETASATPFAFACIPGLTSISLPEGLKVGKGAFMPAATDALLHVQIRLSNPMDGQSVFDLHFPRDFSGTRMLSYAFATDRVDIQRLALCCDEATNGQGQQIFEFPHLCAALLRLENPWLLDPEYRDLISRPFTLHPQETALGLARKGAANELRTMVELGFLDKALLSSVIDALSEAGNTAMTGFLLQLKQSRFGTDFSDFDL